MQLHKNEEYYDEIKSVLRTLNESDQSAPTLFAPKWDGDILYKLPHFSATYVAQRFAQFVTILIFYVKSMIKYETLFF